MNRFIIEIKWGIIFSQITLVWMIIEKSVGLHDQLIAKQAIYSNLFAIPAIIVYVLALKNKKKAFYNNNINWAQAFVSGIYLSIVIALLSPLIQYITFEFISPNYFENMVKHTVSNKILSFEKATEIFNERSYIIQNSIASLSMGVVTAAVISYFIQTKNINLKVKNK